MVLRSIHRAGVSCIVSKSDALEQLIPAVRAACCRQTFISPEIARLIVLADAPAELEHAKVLSKRESEVLRMFAEGLSVLEIAERVGRSRKTISTQKVAAMRKLGLKRDGEIFDYALTHGLVQASQNARAGAGGEG